MEVYTAAVRPMLLAIIANTYLTGLVGCQYMSYIRRKYNDTWITKFTVINMAIIDTFVAFLTVYMLWTSCVPNHLGPIHNIVSWTFTIVPICTSLSGLLAHSFLARKYQQLTNNKALLISIAMWTFMASTFIFGMLAGIYGTAFKISLLEHVPINPSLDMNIVMTPFQNYVFIWMCLQVMVDAGISLILKFALSSPEAITLNSLDARSNSRFNRIASCITQTAFLSLLYSFAAVLVNMAAPRRSKTLCVIVFLPLGRLYTSSVLFNLLARNVQSTTTGDDCIQLTQDIWVVKDADEESQTSCPTRSINTAENLINSKSTPHEILKIELPELNRSNA